MLTQAAQAHVSRKNHTLFKAIIGMKLPTFYRQIANTLPTDHRQSTDSRLTVGQQISCRKLSFQKNLNKSVGQLLVRCWSTVGQLSANSRPTDRRQSADRLPTVGRQITNSRPTDNQQSADCRLGELFFTVTQITHPLNQPTLSKLPKINFTLF